MTVPTERQMRLLCLCAGIMLLQSAVAQDLDATAAPSRLQQIEALQNAWSIDEDQLRSIAAELSLTDFPTAAASVLQWTNRSTRKTVFGIILAHWARRDPLAAVEFAEGVEDKELHRLAFYRVYYNWPVEGRSDAFDRLRRYPDGIGDKRDALAAIVQRLGPIDPFQTLQDLLAAGDVTSRNPAIYHLFQSWAEKDLEEAVAAAETLEEDKEKSAAYFKIAQTWGCRDPEAALAWAEQLPESFRPRMTGHVLSSVACVNPALAALTVTNLPPDQYNFAGRIVNAWLAQDPEATREWVFALEPSAFRRHGLNTLLARTVSSNLQDGVELALALTNREERTECIQQVAQWWAQPFTGMHSDGILQPGLHDLDGARAWADSLTNDLDRLAAAEGLSSPWGRRDRIAMLDYLAALPASGRKHFVVAQAFHGCIGRQSRDQTDLKDWIFRQDDADMAAACLGKMLYMTGTRDLLEYAERTARLQDERLQQALAATVYRAWKKQDASAAEHWLGTLECSDDTREQIRHPRKKKQKK